MKLFTPFLLFISLSIIITACKKADIALNEVSNTQTVDYEKKFFELPANTAASVVRIAESIKSQNEKFHFVNELAVKEGLPVWNKAIIQLQHKRNAGNTVNAGSDTVIIIPFVLENTEYVNSFIACVVGDSVGIKLFRARDYAQAGFHHIADSVSADKIALQTMALEKNVFNHADYRLLDNRLFNHTENGVTQRPEFCKIDSIFYSTTPSYMYNIQICYQITINGGDLTGCPPTTNCNSLHTFEICDTYSFWMETGGGTTTTCFTCAPWWITNPGNSGNQSGGGLSIGWTSTLNPPPPPTTSPDSVIIQKLKVYSLAINHIADSVFNLSMVLPQKEYGFIIVMNSGSIYPKNIKTDGYENDVKQNWFTQNYEILLADWHAHPDPSADTNKRPAPSPDDIISLNNKGHGSTLNYISFIDCGNVRYAFAIQDKIKSAAYFRNLLFSQKNLTVEYMNLLRSNPNYNSNYQLAGEQTILTLIGSASLNGIGLYKSINPTKTQYQKLN